MINSLSPDFTDLPGLRTLPGHYKPSSEPVGHIDVSVITPYFNTEDFFVETFVSLQSQSLQNWEWVIVDDGSTDQESVKRLAGIAEKDRRIKVIRQANAGPSAARNTAYRNSKGRYVCLLDSDDMVEPTYLEKCVWFLDSNPEFAFCNTYSVVFGEQEYLWKKGFERGKAHTQANSGPPISVIRRSAYSDCGGFDESIRFGHEDWDFWLAMAKAGHWGYTIAEYLQWYRKRSNGRFEQIMKSGNVNNEFEVMMQRKYAGLDKCFPEPARRHAQPLVNNPLVENPKGRRIMFVIPWMVTGGADRVNLELIEGLADKGHDITLCATLRANHNWEHQFSRFTTDIFVLPNILHPTDYPRFLVYMIQSRRMDTVVVSGSTVGYQLLPYLRSIFPTVAFIDLSHVEELHWLNGGHPRFAVGYQDTLDLNIVTTRHLSEWMQGRGADKERIRVMYTGIRAHQAEPQDEVRGQIRAELGIAMDMPVIVFAGRLCEQKRPAMLATILGSLREQGSEFKAFVIGDGELRGQLESLLTQYGLNQQVYMLGSVPHQRWLKLLAASDILLMPSQYEGISIALLEAMAAGVVPVVAKVGGQSEIVSQDAGVLIQHSENELQDYLDALKPLIADRSKLHSMSAQCKELIATKFSWGGMIDNFLSILKEAHQLKVTRPQFPVSPGLGLELATLAMEYKRLCEAVDWLWHSKGKLSTANRTEPSMSSESMALARIAVLLSQTWLFRVVTQNRISKILGKKFLSKLQT